MEDLTASNIDELLSDADIVLDGTDNFETRYLVNDFCVQRGIPWYGAAVGSYGVTMPVVPGVTACLACVYPSPPEGVQPTCESAGVLGPLTSLIASLQCAAAMKLLSGHAVEPLLTTVDIWSGAFRQIRQPKPDPDCRACGRRQFDYLDSRRRAPVSLCGRNAVQIHERNRPLDLSGLRRQLEPLRGARE